MIGTTIVFNKNVQTGTDLFNNPVNEVQQISIDNCLIAPITEPTNAREQQAMSQSRDQVRIHIPKTSDADVSDSTVVWLGKRFKIDSDSVAFMTENTPTRWNRYFRGEAVNG